MAVWVVHYNESFEFDGHDYFFIFVPAWLLGVLVGGIAWWRRARIRRREQHAGIG